MHRATTRTASGMSSTMRSRLMLRSRRTATPPTMHTRWRHGHMRSKCKAQPKRRAMIMSSSALGGGRPQALATRHPSRRRYRQAFAILPRRTRLSPQSPQNQGHWPPCRAVSGKHAHTTTITMRQLIHDTHECRAFEGVAY